MKLTDLKDWKYTDIKQSYFKQNANLNARQSEKNKIIEVSINRKIESCYHFTKLKNLPSILNNGICSLYYMDKYDIHWDPNDYSRADNHPDAISISITFPNYKTFGKFWRNSKEKFIIFELDASNVFTLDCAFYPSNAANGDFKLKRLQDFMTCEALNMMFQEDRARYRFNRGLKDNEPTDVQAEVMVFDNIPINFIKRIIIQKNSLADYLATINDLKVADIPKHEIDESFFKYRLKDYKTVI